MSALTEGLSRADRAASSVHSKRRPYVNISTKAGSGADGTRTGQAALALVVIAKARDLPVRTFGTGGITTLQLALRSKRITHEPMFIVPKPRTSHPVLGTSTHLSISCTSASRAGSSVPRIRQMAKMTTQMLTLSLPSSAFYARPNPLYIPRRILLGYSPTTLNTSLHFCGW
jgi:hypothetical protein